MMLPRNLAFLSGDVGSGEVLFIFAVVLVFLGPRRLPEIARTIGRVIHELRRASRDFQDQIMQIDAEPPPAEPHARALSVAKNSRSDFGGPALADDACPDQSPAGVESGAPTSDNAQGDAGVLNSAAAAEPDADGKEPEHSHVTSG